jgi:hypothetical protein
MDRDGYLELEEVDAGTYHFFVEMEYHDTCTSDLSMSLTCYGPKGVSLGKETSSRHRISDVLSTAWCSKVKQKMEDITTTDMNERGHPEIKRHSGSKNAEGYNFVVVKNESQHATYKETTEFTNFEGLELLSPHSGNKFVLEVGPGKVGAVTTRVSVKGYSMASSKMV